MYPGPEVPQRPPASSMSSVNSPACLLARNHFYRSASPTEKVKPVFSLTQSQVSIWVTTSSHQGIPGQETSKWVVNVVLKSPVQPPPNS